MTAVNRRAAVVGIGLLFVTALGVAATPRRRLADEMPALDLESAIPAQLGEWHVDQGIAPVLPAPDVQERLDKLYNKQLLRTYVNSQGQRVMFVIAYGADQADRMTLAHLPEACYSSQGFQVFPTEVASIALGDGQMRIVRLQTKKGPRVEPVSYWTTVGSRTLVDEVGRRWERARYSMLGFIPDGMLVRVSSIDTDPAKAFALHADFIAQLHGALPAPVRERLFGSQG